MQRVYIGVGHGGKDSGACGNGLKEKELNLSVALEVYRVLLNHGLNVMLSRKSDDDETLDSRVKECNNFDPVLAVDIHHNAGGGDGAECYYHIGGGVGKTLAYNILDEIAGVGQNLRGAKTKIDSNGRDYYGFIRSTKCPAVIVECAFIDNTKDIEIVDSDEEQAKMGEAIAKGILKTLNIKYIGETPKELYRVQVGAFEYKENAEKLVAELKSKGYGALLV